MFLVHCDIELYGKAGKLGKQRNTLYDWLLSLTYFSMLPGIFHDLIWDRLSSGMTKSRGISAIQTVKYAWPEIMILQFVMFSNAININKIVVRPQLNCFGCLKRLTWKCSIFNFNFSIQSSPCLWTIHIDWGTTGGHLQIFSWFNKYFSFYKMLVCFVQPAAGQVYFLFLKEQNEKNFPPEKLLR